MHGQLGVLFSSSFLGVLAGVFYHRHSTTKKQAQLEAMIA